VCALALLVAAPAGAQLNGSHLLGDTGARSRTQGQTLLVTATFPVPTVKQK
jgi:hypothetical protein